MPGRQCQARQGLAHELVQLHYCCQTGIGLYIFTCRGFLRGLSVE